MRPSLGEGIVGVMKVEFAVLYDDHTWDTVIEDVPMEIASIGLEAMLEWFQENRLTVEPRFRKSVMACIYNLSPDAEEDVFDDE